MSGLVDGYSTLSVHRSSLRVTREARTRQGFVTPKGRTNVLLRSISSDEEINAIFGGSSPFATIVSPPVPERSPPIPEHSPVDTVEKKDPSPRTAGIVRSQTSADLARSHFEYPSARSLILMQIVMSAGYCAYMLTSWSYCAIQRQTLFPNCSTVWGGSTAWGTWGCIATSLLFWTFPLFCCIVFLLYMYRDLLHTRLYYEMFSHRVHLDFMNIGFFQASMVQMMFVWMLICLLWYPMASGFTIKHILLTLPFWIPVLSFGAMFYTQWDLETRLLSVAKFVEDDVEWANKHMFQSYFLRDYLAEAAFQNVIKTLEKQRPTPQLTMGEFITLIAEEAERQHENGEEPDEAKAFKRLSRSWFSTNYWVRLIVYNNQAKYIVDKEAVEFRWWFFFYEILSLVLALFISGLIVITVVTYMHQQGILPSSVLTDWVNLDYLNTEESPANAVATTVTTGGIRAYQHAQDIVRMGKGKVAELLPPHPEFRSMMGSGMPTKRQTQDPAMKEAPMGNAVAASLSEYKRIENASDQASKQQSKEKSRGRKHKNNGADGMLDKFKLLMSQT